MAYFIIQPFEKDLTDTFDDIEWKPGDKQIINTDYIVSLDIENETITMVNGETFVLNSKTFNYIQTHIKNITIDLTKENTDG